MGRHIESFPAGTELTREAIDKYFATSLRTDGRPLFVDGDRQLRDGFALMLDAMTDPDPATPQQTTLQSNFLGDIGGIDE